MHQLDFSRVQGNPRRKRRLRSVFPIADDRVPAASELNANLMFPPGFQADFALAWDASIARLYQLANGGNDSMTLVADAALTPPGNPLNGQWEMNLTLSHLGLSPGQEFRYVVTYLNDSIAWRSDEFHGVAQSTVPGGNIGQNPVTLATDDFNRFTSYTP